MTREDAVAALAARCVAGPGGTACERCEEILVAYFRLEAPTVQLGRLIPPYEEGPR